jgi:host factor-I protein
LFFAATSDRTAVPDSLTEGWMGKSQVNLQDIFLNQMRKEKIPVTMYLVNGARLTGTIKGFDNFVILLKQENQQLVYKHAISTIIPEKPLEILEAVETRKAEQEQTAQA